MDAVHRMNQTDEGYQVKISADNVAIFVFLETYIEGIFSENGFMMTEKDKIVEFYPRMETNSRILLGSIEITSISDTYDVFSGWKMYWERKIGKIRQNIQ